MSHQESAKPNVQTKEAFINTCSVKGWMSYLDEKKCMKRRIIKTFSITLLLKSVNFVPKDQCIEIHEIISITVQQILEDATNIY